LLVFQHVLSIPQAVEIVETFLNTTEFEGGEASK
jgi:hypothetical protein